MKKNALLFLSILSFGMLNASGQSVLELTKAADDTRNTFQGGKEITKSALADPNGFIIRVNNTGITGIGMLNSNGTYIKIPAKPHGSSGIMDYLVASPKTDSLGNVVLEIYTRNTNSTFKLTLTEKKSGTRDLDKDVIYSGKGCDILTFDKNFGENVNDYDDDKVVYIYDFDPVRKTKTFYKVYRSKTPEGKYELKKDVVNFNRERIKPNTHFQLKVININKFRYEINLEHGFSEFDSQPSALFKQFFLGDDSLLASLSGAFTSGLKTTAQSSDDVKKVLEKNKAFLKK